MYTAILDETLSLITEMENSNCVRGNHRLVAFMYCYSTMNEAEIAGTLKAWRSPPNATTEAVGYEISRQIRQPNSFIAHFLRDRHELLPRNAHYGLRENIYARSGQGETLADILKTIKQPPFYLKHVVDVWLSMIREDFIAGKDVQDPRTWNAKWRDALITEIRGDPNNTDYVALQAKLVDVIGDGDLLSNDCRKARDQFYKWGLIDPTFEQFMAFPDPSMDIVIEQLGY